jgi:hypothetical protein
VSHEHDLALALREPRTRPGARPARRTRPGARPARAAGTRCRRTRAPGGKRVVAARARTAATEGAMWGGPVRPAAGGGSR